MRYFASKNHKAFMADLKPVYRAATLGEAEDALDVLEENWGKNYPIVIKSWRGKWELLSTYFRYPEPIRRIMYTTNAVEAVHPLHMYRIRSPNTIILPGSLISERLRIMKVFASSLMTSERS